MSDPVGERLRSYYQSIQGEAPAHLESRVSRAIDSAPPRPAGLRWRPVFALAAVVAVVAVVVTAALIFNSVLPVPVASPSSSVPPSSIPSASASLSTGPVTSPSPEPTKPTPTSTPAPTPTETPSPAPTPLRGNGNLVAVGAMSPYISGPAVNLQNATVLVAGGMTVQSNGIRAKSKLAEIYHMDTHAFTPTGSMADARFGHTATLLQDGRVLVVGGADLMDGIDNLATAEIYDPASGTFTRTGSMAQGRADHTATLLADGRVLITGGFGGGTLPVATAEIYDPTTGKFTPTGSMTVARMNHTATLIPGGRVLITGGLDANSHVLSSAEVWDPATGTFHATGTMTTPREWHTATSLGDDRVLIAGGAGADGTTALESAEIYDPSTGKFTATGSMKTARYSHTATLLSYGQVIVAGGQGINSMEVYWPDLGTFGYLRPTLGSIGAAVSLSDRVLFTGDPPELYCPWPATQSPCQ